MTARGYDYVIVGAGTAGCVVAGRLASGTDASVLLLEAGGDDKAWQLRMPSAFGQMFEGGRHNWSLSSVEQRTLNDRRVFQPRGRALGGSSSINGMVFVRGHARDFDDWAQMGAAGWGYDDVLPYFKRLETYLGPPSAYRGDHGPVTIRRGVADHPVNQAFLQAGEQAGYAFSADPNGERQEGFSRWDMNIDNGVRASSAHAYLRKLDVGSRLTVATDARATRLVVENGRAVGLQYLHRGEVRTVRADAEIILCCGAFHSPQLLLLSGIGPADELRPLGLEVACDLPGVGRNLQDHMYIMVQYRSKKPVTLNRYARLGPKAMAGARWFANRSGPASTNHVEVGAFLRSPAAVSQPDVQIHFKPVLLEGWSLSRDHGFNFGAGTLRPKSVGHLRLQSADFADPPLIDPNYLSEPGDLVDMRNAVKMSREIASQRGFDEFRGDEALPGGRHGSDAEIDAFIRAEAGSAYHPVGTCRMGQDALAVCSPDLRVRGIEGLRVADASVFPCETSGNTNAPSFMVGEKAADLIAGKPALPRVSTGRQTR